MATKVLPDEGGVHGTLSGTTADVVTVRQFHAGQTVEVCVINLTGSGGAIYARGDGTTAVAAADGTKVIEPGGFAIVEALQAGNGRGELSIVGQDGYLYSAELA